MDPRQTMSKNIFIYLDECFLSDCFAPSGGNSLGKEQNYVIAPMQLQVQLYLLVSRTGEFFGVSDQMSRIGLMKC